MALHISGLSLPFTQPSQAAIEQALGMVKGEMVLRAYLVKQSVDARRREDIRTVYTVGLDMEGDEAAIAGKLGRDNVRVRNPAPLEIRREGKAMAYPPVVVGFGPAGMFAALVLARQGLRPVVVERGSDVDTRAVQVSAFWSTGALNPQSNIQFGEGGAGTFSDGKLTTRIGDSRCGFVLRELHSHGGPDEILFQAKPHMGTDNLRRVVKAIREEIVALGGQVLFDTRLEDILIQNGKVAGARTSQGDIPSPVLVLAPGHSARDVFPMLLRRGVPVAPKPFSVGVRIEHLQSEIDAALYGRHAGHPMLPRGEYQLSHREDGRAVYTFCMCPGGVVVPAASEPGMVVTNGMSVFARDGENANAALVVSVDSGDFGDGPLDGVEFQRRLETAAFYMGGGGYRAPAQTVDHFQDGMPGFRQGRVTPSYAVGVEPGDFASLFPAPIVEMMQLGLRRFSCKLPGFAVADAFLTGVETRTSSPVRVARGEEMESEELPGLFPCGEGAGYAGGIVSAAVDGVRAAQGVLMHYGG